MGREVRMVPADWQHPTDGKYPNGEPRYIALFEGPYSQCAAEYAERKSAWERGEFPDYASEESKLLTFKEWDGEAPKAEDYMPEWPAEQRTHLMMYETCSEGTPISPAFKTPEELARWLADNGASSFGRDTASYESWLRVCRGCSSISAVFIPGRGLVNGVDAINEIEVM